MKKIIFFAFIILLAASCTSDSKFTVTGNISDAEGKRLYLEASEIQGIVLLDSVKLKGNGSFKFKQPKPQSPEFYRLRVENKVINFSVDSTETITIHAPYSGFSTEYTVEGSPSSEKIKELTLKQIKLQNDVNALLRSKLRSNILEDSISALMTVYKDEVKFGYIFAAPNTAAAYFALFQKVNDYLIFDPLNNRNDLKCFRAVATSLDVFYPHAVRSKNLRNLVIKGLKNTRPPRENIVELPEEKFTETGIIDIALRDIKGNIKKLSDLTGKVVLLDFTVYQSTVSVTHNFALNDLFEKYSSKGLVIYQVSLDADEHYWKTVADNLPWMCVRDPNGIYSTILSAYNIQQLPSYFLINRKSELSARGDMIEDMDAAIKALL